MNGNAHVFSFNHYVLTLQTSNSHRGRLDVPLTDAQKRSISSTLINKLACRRTTETDTPLAGSGSARAAYARKGWSANANNDSFLQRHSSHETLRNGIPVTEEKLSGC